MTDKDFGDFRGQMMKLGAIHQRALPRDVLDSYFDALKHLEIGAVKRAFTKAIGTCQFFPKPVELLELAGGAEAPVYREVDGERVFACLECEDRGTVMHLHPKAGWMARPCSCSAGDRIRERWKTPDSIGRVVAEQAKANARKLDELG